MIIITTSGASFSPHIDGSSLPTGDDDAQWYKRDGLVKLWIYGTLAPDLFKSSFETGEPLETFHTPRNSGLCLTALLMLMLPYRITRFVTYLLYGLNEKFDNIINVIQHRDPFLSFATAKSMLQMEETRLKRFNKSVPKHSDHSSSSTVLTVAAFLDDGVENLVKNLYEVDGVRKHSLITVTCAKNKLYAHLREEIVQEEAYLTALSAQAVGMRNHWNTFCLNAKRQERCGSSALGLSPLNHASAQASKKLYNSPA
ncbi:Uncharacterized protein Rs2_19082 [Raphanus sativus]|nr:Uncharacterized protein Rs2_19082 [Raphanus sativus]